jgi:hypothetical protein
MRVTNDIPLGCPLLLPVGTVTYVETQKARRRMHPLLHGTRPRERTLLVFGQGFALEDAIGSHDCSGVSQHTRDPTTRFSHVPFSDIWHHEFYPNIQTLKSFLCRSVK